jgi:hypothetical protein
MPELNEKLIACVLRHIEANPDEYDQNTWFSLRDTAHDQSYCGTTACFAGWACLLSKDVTKWADRRQESVRVEATALLGLTDYEASTLFGGVTGDDPVHNLGVVKERLRTIRRQRGLPPDGPAVEKVQDDSAG